MLGGVFMFNIKSFTGIAVVLAASFGQSFAKDDRWFFTAAEIADAYAISNSLAPSAPSVRAANLFRGQERIRRVIRRQTVRGALPVRRRNDSPTKEELLRGAAKYLFPLDVDAADLAVPANVYESKYKQLPREEILLCAPPVNLR